MFVHVARAAGFSTARRWSDGAGWFGVFLFT
jgi:hypothetical protein